MGPLAGARRGRRRRPTRATVGPDAAVQGRDGARSLAESRPRRPFDAVATVRLCPPALLPTVRPEWWRTTLQCAVWHAVRELLAGARCRWDKSASNSQRCLPFHSCALPSLLSLFPLHFRFLAGRLGFGGRPRHAAWFRVLGVGAELERRLA